MCARDAPQSIEDEEEEKRKNVDLIYSSNQPIPCTFTSRGCPCISLFPLLRVFFFYLLYSLSHSVARPIAIHFENSLSAINHAK